MKHLPKVSCQLLVVSCQKKQKAFTLIELLVVIGILTILLAIVLIAINPLRQFAQARDTKRRSDLKAILDAVHQYAADHRGQFPAEVPSGTPEVISDATATEADICSDIVPTYIAEMPVDPNHPDADYLNCGNYDTGQYSIVVNGGRITVTAPAEVDAPNTISITR